MMLGVVIHSAFIFSTYTWRVTSEVHLKVFSQIIDFIHSFRMESFYIIAGFFSMLVMKKYSLQHFIKSRFFRLGVPLLFCGFTLNIVMLGYSYTNEFNLSNLLTVSFWLHGGWLAHLWFLANLIGYSIILYFTINLPSFKYTKTNYWIFVIVVVLFQMILSRISWRIPSEKLNNTFVFFDISKFIRYIPFFWIGIKMFVNKELYEKLLSINIFNSIVVILYFVIKAYPINGYIEEVISALYGLSFPCLLFSVFKFFFDKRNKFVESVSDASYTIYLLHQPFIVLWGFFILRIEMPYWVHFLLILIPAWLLPYLFHRYVVKESRVLLLLLNGKNIKPQK